MTACAFRLCTANVIMIVEQATPGDDESTVQRYPLHNVSGTEGLGPCPASLLLSPLSDYDRAHLDERARIIEAAGAAADVAAQAAKPLKKPDALPPHSRAPKPVDKPFWFNGSLGGPYAGKGIGATNDAVKLDFVPSPAPRPLGESGMADSMRGQLRALTLLTINALGQAQEQCAQITHLAEQIDGMMIVLKEKQNAAKLLSVSAVGGDGMAPESANNMVNGALAAGSTLDDAEAALQLFLMRIGHVAASNGAAASQGRDYLGTLGG